MTARRRPFRAWLLLQADRDDAVGDLARDAREDESLPHGRPAKLRAYIDYDRHACHQALEAFDRAVKEWAAGGAR